MSARRLRLLTGLTALSALLCAATALFWIRSYVQNEFLLRAGPAGERGFASLRGALYYLRYPELRSDSPHWDVVRFGRPNRYSDPWTVALRGFGEQPFRSIECNSDPVTGTSGLGVPYWLLCLVTAVLPAVWLIVRGRPRWLKPAAAAAFALWPFTGLLLDAPNLSDGEVAETAGTWVLWAVVAAGLLVLRDRSRLRLRRRKSWVPPFWQWRRRRAYERWVRGLCVECGYDLRAGPEQGGALLPRCPECGAPTRAGAPPVRLG